MKKTQLAMESQATRDHIRNIKRAMTGIDDIQGPASANAVLSKEEMLAELKGKLNRDIVSELHDIAAEKAPAPPKAPSPPPTAKSSKPAWARTEEENEEQEEAEVEDLLAFAEELDIDQYMDDCEFREALSAAKARIQELDSDDEDGRTECTERTAGSVGSVYSTMSQALRAKEEKAARGEEDWDGSVRSESKANSRVSRLSRAVAEELLEMNPNLRRKHSARSLAEVVAKRGMIPDQNKKFDPADHESK